MAVVGIKRPAVVGTRFARIGDAITDGCLQIKGGGAFHTKIGFPKRRAGGKSVGKAWRFWVRLAIERSLK
jgi:hypothetical protein